MELESIVHCPQPKLILLQSKDLVGLIRIIILEVQNKVFLAVLQGPCSVGLQLKACLPQNVQRREGRVPTGQHLQLVLIEVGGYILTSVQGLFYAPGIGNAFLFGPQAKGRSVLILLTTRAKQGGCKCNYKCSLYAHHLHLFCEWVVVDVALISRSLQAQFQVIADFVHPELRFC